MTKNNINKKALILFLTVLSVTLCACGKNSSNTLKESTSSTTDTLTDTQSDTPTDTSVETSADTPTESTTDTEKENNTTVDNIINQVRATDTFEIDASYVEQLTKESTPYEQTPSINSYWQRTNVHSGHSASFNISALSETGFDFSIEAYYFANTGELDGHADYVADNCALSYIEDVDQYIVFIFDEESLIICTTGEAGDYGLGSNVYVYGNYTDGQPVYLNAQIMEETFTAEQIETIKNQLTSEQYNQFKSATKNGAVSVTEDGASKTIEANTPGILGCGYGYTIIITDDIIESFIFDDGTEVEFK